MRHEMRQEMHHRIDHEWLRTAVLPEPYADYATLRSLLLGGDLPRGKSFLPQRVMKRSEC